jgi:mannose-6-phosphate isomerase-like protein (cupin superfamily)
LRELTLSSDDEEDEEDDDDDGDDKGCNGRGSGGGRGDGDDDDGGAAPLPLDEITVYDAATGEERSMCVSLNIAQLAWFAFDPETRQFVPECEPDSDPDVQQPGREHEGDTRARGLSGVDLARGATGADGSGYPIAAGFRVTKGFQTSAFSSGFISIDGTTTSPVQGPDDSTTVFFVLRGAVEVIVSGLVEGDSTFEAVEGTVFYLPPGNVYHFVNHSPVQDSLLAFTCTTGRAEDA